MQRPDVDVHAVSSKELRPSSCRVPEESLPAFRDEGNFFAVCLAWYWRVLIPVPIVWEENVTQNNVAIITVVMGIRALWSCEG